MPTHDIDLLHQPANTLPVSEEFRQTMGKLRFETLEELVAYPAHRLLKMDGFGYRMLKELIALLERNDLSNRLQE